MLSGDLLTALTLSGYPLPNQKPDNLFMTTTRQQTRCTNSQIRRLYPLFAPCSLRPAFLLLINLKNQRAKWF
jgi:hypothetical protein